MASSRLRLLLAALLALAVLGVYARVAGYDFISIDDYQYVSENPQVLNGLSWANVVWAFKTPVAGNWHPLTMLSHMLDCQLFGFRPASQHLTNALLHLANTLLLFFVLLQMTTTAPGGGRSVPERREGSRGPNDASRLARGGGPGRTALPQQSPMTAAPTARTPPSLSTLWPCALVAALFGLHPLHVESVAWVSERKDVLSAFFFLLTLLAYAQWVNAKAPPSNSAPPAPRSPLHAPLWYTLSLLFFALGLLSKPMLVTLPCVLLLLDYWPLRRFERSTPHTPRPTLSPLLLEKLPFFALTLLFSLITFIVQRNAGAVTGLEGYPLKLRLANAMVSYARYLGKTFWPGALTMPYPYPDWPADLVTGATLLFFVLSFLALAAARKRKYLFVGWFWFAGMLVPVIGVVQVGMQSMADRFTYLPLIGIFIALAWGLTSLNQTPARRRILGGLAVLVLAGLTATTWAQVGYWKNSQTLFEHAVQVMPENSAARYLLGAQYDAQGQPDLAYTQFSEAVRANPGNVRARCGLGYLLCQQGKLEDAVQQYEAALQAQPDLAKAHFGLAEVLRRQGRVDPAIAHYLSALQSKPDLAEAHYQVAGLFSVKHDPATALTHLQEAVRLAPDWPLALNNLAWSLATQPEANLRNGTEATRLALHAVSLTQNANPGTLDTLAAAYAEADHFADAVATAQTAIQQANAAGLTNLAAEIQTRLKLYQSQKPYRE